MYILWNNHHNKSNNHHHTELLIFFIIKTSMIYSFSNFQIYNIVLLTIVTMLYITFPGLIYFINGGLYILTASVSYCYITEIMQLEIERRMKRKRKIQKFHCCVGSWQLKWILAGVAQWLSTGLWNTWSLGQFSVRAHAWVADQVSSRGRVRGSHTVMFLSLSFSLPLSKNK